MISDLKPYPEYKESGRPWIGQIPRNWSIIRIKNVLQELDCRSLDGKGTLLSLSRVRGLIRHCDMTDKVQSAKNLVGYKRYELGHIVMNRMQAWSGMFGAGPIEGLVSPDYAVFKVLGGHDTRIVLERLKAPDLVRQFALESKGIGSGFNRLYTDRFGGIPITLPPLAEQAVIVLFVDWANRRLERATRAKRKVIALLEERKEIIIQRAVTRGLDPSVPIKPSCIPWLGEIPQHWEVRRLKNLAHFQSGEGITALEIEPKGDYPVYGGNGLRGYTNRYTHDGHHVLIGRQGALCGNINYAQGKFFASEHAVVTTLRPDHSVEWFGELLRVMNLNQYSQSAAQPGLAVEFIKNLSAPVPPVAEQKAIVVEFQQRTVGLIATISRLEREIGLLHEYRTRLVSDVVTGKLDVREQATRLPIEAAEPADTGIALDNGELVDVPELNNEETQL